MLHTAEPDPVISAHMHHYAKSLRWGGYRAIFKFHAVRSARFAARFNREGRPSGRPFLL